MKLLFCGRRGVGKSTMIRRLVPPGFPVAGFETFFAQGEDGGTGLYMRRPWDVQALCGPENQVGRRGAVPGTAVGFPQVFDRYGTSLLRDIPAGSLVVMDELGHLEREAALFLQQVRRILTGPYHVLAAVKDVDQPYLREFRELSGVKALQVTPENREEQYLRARAWLEKAGIFSRG